MRREHADHGRRPRRAAAGEPGRAHGRLRFVGTACLLASLAVQAVPAPPAIAAAKPITGKLSRPGFAVIALAEDGRARTIETKDGKFRLKPPARKVTLHLRAADGTYAGPIVMDRHKKRAILGVEAGTDLGRIKVKDGYAKVAHAPDETSLDPKRYAKASKKGVPIGAGTFGRVLVTPGGNVPGDIDRDGVADPLDIDDDGDLILDNLDPSSPARSRSPTTPIVGCGPNNVFCSPIASVLVPSRIEDTVNVSAGSTAASIDAAQVSFGVLRFAVPGHAELDCGDPDSGLSYCRANSSTGVASASGPGPPFPGCCDADGDGFGTLDPMACQGCAGGFFIAARATTSEIGSGDVLIAHVSTGVPESECPPPPGQSNTGCTSFPATLNYVFATTPALVSYSDETGNAATVSYPVGDLQPGTFGNGFPVDDGPEDPDSDVEVTLTFFPPQRPALPGSDPPGTEYMDMGHLTYGAVDPSATGPCPQSAFSTTDPNLTPSSLQPLLPGFTDLRNDQPNSPTTRFSYTLNLSQCHPGFASGDELNLQFQARVASPDFAAQSVWFEHV